MTGKIALVTGGGSGIGAACVKALAALGHTVAVADRDGDAAAEVAGQAPGAFALTVDVTDPDQVERMVSTVVAQCGRLDIAVNNAGIVGPMGRIGDISLKAYRKVVEVNLDGVFYSMHYELPAMVAGGGGVIVNTASIAGLVSQPYVATYTATKHAVVGLTKAAAKEYAGDGIRVLAIAPGCIETPLNPQGILDIAVSMTPMGRAGQPDEVAGLVCFLVSDAAGYLTGSVHSIDGGMAA